MGNADWIILVSMLALVLVTLVVYVLKTFRRRSDEDRNQP
jgi:hypothetical protein